MEQTQASQEAKLHFLDYWRVVKTRKAIVFVVFLLVLLVTATVTYFQPKVYSATTRIKVEQERPSVEVFQQQGTPGYDPYFLQTQYEIIQSRKILYPVVERLNLPKLWASRNQPLPVATTEMAFQRLSRGISCRRFRDTSLIEIATYDEDPQLAAQIANTVADTFERERLEEKRRQVLKGLDKLREEMDQQQERVRNAQLKIEQLRKDLGVPIIGTGPNATKLTDQTLEQLQAQLVTARTEAVGRETRLRELKKLSPQQLRNTIATVISDPNVQQLLQNLTDTETRLEAIKENLGPEHPDIRAALASRDKLQQQLDARLEGVMRGFEVEYLMAQSRVTELQSQLDAAKNASVSLEGEKFLPFRNAQREEEMETRLYEALKSRLQQVSIEMEVPRSPVEVIDRAQTPMAPVRPNMWLNCVMGAIVGLILGVGLAFFFEFLDTSIKKVDDIERYLGLPVLGVVARQAELLFRGTASPVHIEAYRMLRANIEFAKADSSTKSMCVLSAGAGEGKSFSCANLAFVYAQHGARVLVVDGDLRRPCVHQYFGVPNNTGLADHLSGTKSVDEIIQTTTAPNVWVITSGTGLKSALPMLTSERMEQLIREVSQRFDMVLYDTPPILGVSDAAVIAREVGTAILVVQHRRYPRTMSVRARQVIENAGGKLLGVIVNNVNVGQDESYYYYHDHYDRYLQVPETMRPPTIPEAKKPSSDEIELHGKY